MHKRREFALRTFLRHPNEPIQNVALFESAWDECAELQVRPKEVWVSSSLIALGELERYELAVLHGIDVVGAAVLAIDPWDAHVGVCMSVFAQYVMPEYRNAGASMKLMLESRRIARGAGVGILAYTHRVAPWRYETNYRRV